MQLGCRIRGLNDESGDIGGGRRGEDASPLTETKPKVMLPIAGKPILQYVVSP
jgi:dTDP-glucose pyrophosphorylase